jgi:hypothetical protein
MHASLLIKTAPTLRIRYLNHFVNYWIQVAAKKNSLIFMSILKITKLTSFALMNLLNVLIFRIQSRQMTYTTVKTQI